MPDKVQSRMNPEDLRHKLSGIKRGERIKITPLNVEEGDPFDTIGIPWTEPAKKVYALKDPFYAVLDHFDGVVLWVISDQHGHIRIPYDELKGISLLVNVPTNVSAKSMFI